MIETKYLIMIGVIICLLVLYYFYDEIFNIKKSFLPTYQKTMALEAKVMELDKRMIDIVSKKSISKIESSPLSITYYSDMVKNGNLSVKYADLSDTEASNLLKQINKPHRVNSRNTHVYRDKHDEPPQFVPNPVGAHDESKTTEINNQLKSLQKNNELSRFVPNMLSTHDEPSRFVPNSRGAQSESIGIQHGELSDIIITSDTANKKLNETDSFDVSIGHLVGNKKNFQNLLGTHDGSSRFVPNLLNKYDEYKEIFDGLEKELIEYKTSEKTKSPEILDWNRMNNFNSDDSELNSDIIRNISESVQYGDLSSENSISDIPIVPKKKLQKKTAKRTKSNYKTSLH